MSTVFRFLFVYTNTHYAQTTMLQLHNPSKCVGYIIIIFMSKQHYIRRTLSHNYFNTNIFFFFFTDKTSANCNSNHHLSTLV